MLEDNPNFLFAGVEGVEPPVSALEADGLPLTDTPTVSIITRRML